MSEAPADEDRSRGRGRRSDLRRRAARGTLVNAGYLIALNMLGLVKGFAVAAFLDVDDYGVWGLLALSFVMLMSLLQVGIGDRYIQQDDEDQETAFQVAFTLQVGVCAVFVVVMAAALPLFAVAYGDASILLPGWVLCLAIPGFTLQAPLWAHYRRMDFFTQRKLQSFDPVVGFVVTVALAAAGASYWSMVIGTVAGAWAAAIAAIRASPYRLRLRYVPGTLAEYRSFSGPLFFAALAGSLIGFVPVVVAQRHLGLVAVGALAVANNISVYAGRVDEIVTNTIYPAICAVRDRRDLLLETFLKSNRLALLWAVPAGAGMVLFAPDLVEHVLGERWHVATFLIQAFGAAAALNQVGFNWTAFYRALGDTRPVTVSTWVMLATVIGFGVPLLLTEGIDGYGVAMIGSMLSIVAVRMVYLARLFPMRPIAVNVARGLLPTAPAVAAVMALRLGAGGGERELVQALAELGLFAAIVGGLTVFSERALIAEFRGYLRRQPAAPAQA